MNSNILSDGEGATRKIAYPVGGVDLRSEEHRFHFPDIDMSLPVADGIFRLYIQDFPDELGVQADLDGIWRSRHSMTRGNSPTCGASPDHVKPHAQRILDVGNLLAGVRMETFVPPFPHPLNGGVEEGRVNETAVRPEGPGGSQDMQVGMPVQKLPGGLDGDDDGGKSVSSGIFTQE